MNALRTKTRKGARKGVGIFKQTFKEFSDDECMNMGAALAYYTVFSLPPLLLIIVMVAGFFIDPMDVQRQIEGQAGDMIGADAARQIHGMITSANAQVQGDRGLFGLLIGFGALLFGATGAFAQLQYALNKTWEVKPDPKKSSILAFVLKRVLSLGMILGVAFLLLVSLVLSAILNALGEQLGALLPSGFSSLLLEAINQGVSFLVIALLFSAIFKVLPDARIAWRHVWVAGIVTAILFTLGKFALGFYLGHSNPGSAFGAAGSVVLILVWIYYSSIILLLGAEFAQVWTRSSGDTIEPEKGAIRVEKVHTQKAPGDGHPFQEDRPYQPRF